MAQKVLTLKLSEEQAEQIKGFINFKNWEVEVKEQNVYSSQPAQENIRQETNDPFQDSSQEECPFCLLQPCVTLIEQAWFGDGRDACLTNRGIRKEKYRKFWSTLSYRGAWNEARYIAKKELTLQQQDDAENGIIVWTRPRGRPHSVREIMPDCVLKFVRNLYPNPPQYQYMGHKWH